MVFEAYLGYPTSNDLVEFAGNSNANTRPTNTETTTKTT